MRSRRLQWALHFQDTVFKLKDLQLLHAVPLINVSSKTVDLSEDPRDGTGVASFCLQYQV